jgi:hypothetical protein
VEREGVVAVADFCQVTKLPPKRNRQREARIDQEIVVDAYTPEERAMGWYYYLERQLCFPFTATCIKRRATSPFKIGELLSVTRLASEEDCMGEIIVLTKWRGRALGVPLSQLRPGNVDADTKEGVEDWHYWVAKGYQY